MGAACEPLANSAYICTTNPVGDWIGEKLFIGERELVELLQNGCNGGSVGTLPRLLSDAKRPKNEV